MADRFLVVQLSDHTWRIVITTRRVNDVQMRGKCSLRPVKYFYFSDNSLSTKSLLTIKEWVLDWFSYLNMVKIVKDSHSTMFLSLRLNSFENLSLLQPSLSLATISAFPQSTPLLHSTVCRARPPSSLPFRFSADRVFPLWRSSFVSLPLKGLSEQFRRSANRHSFRVAFKAGTQIKESKRTCQEALGERQKWAVYNIPCACQNTVYGRRNMAPFPNKEERTHRQSQLF